LVDPRVIKGFSRKSLFFFFFLHPAPGGPESPFSLLETKHFSFPPPFEEMGGFNFFPVQQLFSANFFFFLPCDFPFGLFGFPRTVPFFPAATTVVFPPFRPSPEGKLPSLFPPPLPMNQESTFFLTASPFPPSVPPFRRSFAHRFFPQTPTYFFLATTLFVNVPPNPFFFPPPGLWI